MPHWRPLAAAYSGRRFVDYAHHATWARTAARGFRLADPGYGAGREMCALFLAAAHLGPGVAQADRAVEHQRAGLGVRVAGKIALALELHRVGRIVPDERRLDHGAGEPLERVGIEVGGEIGRIGVGPGEQRVV